MGRDGWILSPHLDILALECEDHFVMVARKTLLELSNNLCDINDIVEHKNNALYKGYTRKKWGRDDLITKVTMDDVKSVKHFIWKKV